MNTYSSTLRTILFNASEPLKAISEADFAVKPAPHKWSKKEILGHLIDSAYNNHQRFLRAEAQGDLVFQGYNQDEWVLKNNYQNRYAEQLHIMWYSVNFHMSYMIAGLSDKLLQEETTQHNFHRICMNRIPEGQPTTLGYLVWDYLFHMEHHLSQISSDYEKIVVSHDKMV